VEFLERSCTAEFSGFLLYKELGRRLKKTNPVVAEVRRGSSFPAKFAFGTTCRSPATVHSLVL
jgi:Rubrerythrin